MRTNYSDSYIRGQQRVNNAKKIISGVGGVIGPLGESLSGLINKSVQTLFDDDTRHSRFKQGVWYRQDPSTGEYYDVSNEVGAKKTIHPGAKYVAEPWRKPTPVKLRAANPEVSRTINNDPTFAYSSAPLLPTHPHDIDDVEKGFDQTNFDPSPALIPIFDDGRSHINQPHPSSHFTGNAAIPYTSQGFRVHSY